MKKKEIIDKILQYHPNIEHYHGCDEYKSGFVERFLELSFNKLKQKGFIVWQISNTK